MTPKSLFTILIKIMGIFFMLQAINLIPQFFTQFLVLISPYSGAESSTIIMLICVFSLVIGLFYITLRYCFFKTDWIIEKLSLDKHFTEEKFDLNIKSSTVLSISVIVIGGLMIVDAFPTFCSQLYSYVGQKHQLERFGENQNTSWIIYHGVKVLIGAFLVTKTRLVVDFIDAKSL